MLLNTWLSAAKRHLFGSTLTTRGSERRNLSVSRSGPGRGEELECRQLLTALVINDTNVDTFVDATGTVSIDNADITTGGFDGLVIESLTLNSPTEAISVDLSGITLNRLAIESVNVTAFTGTAIDVNLASVTGLRTISLEDINVSATSGVGVDIGLDSTNAYAITVEDNALPGVSVSAINNSVITHGIVTENTIAAPSGTEGVLLTVNSGGRADNFQIINNAGISTSDKDAVRVDLDNAPTDGLVIANNVIGNEPGADVSFRAEGDTFAQPFELTNLAGDGEQLTQFVFDLRPLGLVFAPDDIQNPVTLPAGSPFAGNITDALSDNNQVLTVDFTQFAPGQTFLFTIDVDIAPVAPSVIPIDFSAFGDDLIGAAVNFNFGAGATSGPKQVSGFLIGDPDVLSASEFVRGDGATTGFNGINLDLTNSPLTNARIDTNQITGVAAHGVLIDASGFSDVSAVVSGNEIVSSGQDGLRFDLEDSNFTGAILNNQIGLNNGNGITFEPTVTRRGEVEAANNSNPFTITSTNHQLQTGDQIILQGVINDDPTINHPANGLHTVVRQGNNEFQLVGVDGTATGVSYAGGGSWYVPDFQSAPGVPGTPTDFPRGLVSIDLQATEPQGRILNIQAPTGGGDAIVTSLQHGLVSGDRVRISRADGTGISGTQSFKVTVLDQDRFSLDGQPLVGTYDTSGGLATWTTNIVQNITNTGEMVVTSTTHGLQTGDQIRMVGVRLTDPDIQPAANGRFTVTRLTDDTFVLQGAIANGDYVNGSGYWVPFAEPTFTGDSLPQLVFGNTVTLNRGAGFHADLSTGTRFNGDIVSNTFTENRSKGIHIESHSFGLGTALPLDPNDDDALPSVQDISFNVNIGTSETDGNQINSNQQAGIVIEALDFATGSFEVRGNQINSNQEDRDPLTGVADPTLTPNYQGDGIVVRLDSDRLSAESVAFLAESVIADNQIGVDARGNEGNGLSFSMSDRTKIQDLEVLDNTFLNNQQDGFHFVRTEDADLNAIVFDDNAATNNVGDGFDIFAENTVKDRLDFRILDSVIDNNGEYGIRVDVQADARVQVDVEGSTIRQNGSIGNGFNPDDGEGAAGEAGGIGIHGFQQVDVELNVVETVVELNTGDGISIDAENFFDAMIVNATVIDSEINLNTRTGVRSVGTAFGTFELTRSDFNGNATDGARFIANVDPTDFFERRVGGQDIDVIGLGNDFQANGNNGLILGQGVSGVFGNGDPTSNFANRFGGRLTRDLDATRRAGDVGGNGQDGLKIVQDAGPYLRDVGRRRVIETDGNVFTLNGGAGVDIGHDVAAEGAATGNVLHGYEVVSDTDIVLNRATLSDNQGDGVEYLADNVLRVYPLAGSGQDNVIQPDISSLTVSNSAIKNNLQRGVDILNRYAEDSRVTVTNNEIIGNGFSGIYVVNTSTHTQLQNGPDDPLDAELYTANHVPSNVPNLTLIPPLFGTTDPDLSRSPNIELRVQDNLIESNGTADRDSTVPINDSNDGNDGNTAAHPDFYHRTNLVRGTLGGLVLRVGTADSSGRITAADAELELGKSGIDAEIWKNSFDGNFGADVYLDNFVSIVPPKSGDRFHSPSAPIDYRWNVGFRDPLARLDLSFRENTGNSLDVINGFAFLDNQEDFFKRRALNGNPAPNPDGPFGNTRSDRNATRTTGYFNSVGQIPGSDIIIITDGSLLNNLFAYDGWGTPTWRVESDFEFANFPQTGLVSGQSDFFDQVNLDTSILVNALAEEPYQWDTGVNVPGFVGVTPYSLARGDIFNVLPGESPILADQLEENDSFLGAYDLGTVSGAGFSVNALATDGRLTIEKKGDRDYYKFIAAGTGSLNVNLSATDADGDVVQFLIYEDNPLLPTSEVPMIREANGAPIRTSVAAGNSGAIPVNVVAGRTYFIEVLSTETSNLGTAAAGKNFNFGTVRSYSLSIDAPVGTVPVVAAPASVPAVVTETISRPGVTAPISIADASPFVASITDVSPDPIGTSVNSLTVTFSEDVTGVNLADFELRRNGVLLDLSGALLAAETTEVYTISNLSPLTNVAGTYTMTVLVASSGIVDTDLSPLIAGANDTETWTVNNLISFTGDVADNVPGDGTIGDASGNASLRAAVMETNANPGEDVIRLAPGNYVLSIGGRFEDEARTGDLDVTDHLTIIGTGTTALDTVIDAADLDRVFHVFPGVVLTLSNLTIQGGEAFDGAGVFVTGGLPADQTTTPITPPISAGRLSLTDVNVINNEAYNQGGGIYNLGNVEALRSSISLNVAGSRGGGIFNHNSVTLTNATVSSNTAVSRGGGIYNELASSAVNPNLAIGPTFGSLDATNVTIAFNHAEAEGGGIFQERAGSVRIGNSIIDQNTAKTFPNLRRAINSDGFNFIGAIGTSVTVTSLQLAADDIVGDQVGAPATTASLNGISSSIGNGTWVHTLAASSIAVDSGSNELYATELGIANTHTALIAQQDQTGGPRLVEGNGDDGRLFFIDRGASEFFISQPVASFNPTPNPVGVNQPLTLDGTGSTHTLVPGTSKIVSYEWDFDYDGVPANFTVDQTGAITSTSYPAIGNVTVALRVTDDTGAVDIHHVEVSVSAPNAPVITAPFTGGTSDLTPTITWDAGAGSFGLVVTNVATSEIVINETALTDSSYTPSFNLPPGVYEAVVTATNASGTASSVPYRFEVIQMTVTDPVNQAVEFDTTPAITFTAIPNAARYQVWVSQLSDTVNDNGSRDTIGVPINDSFVDAAQAQVPGTTLASYEPSSSLGEGFFRVWVRAFESNAANANAGHWSSGAQFQITRPAITGPVFTSRATFDSTPTITWTDVGANQYEVWLTQRNGVLNGQTLTGPVVVFNGIVSGTSYTPPSPLGDGDFRVWVRAVADDGEAGLWSDPYDFTKNLNTGPTLISPIDRVTQTDRTPVFEWQALDGASHYELWVNNINTGASRVIHETNVPHIDGAATITYTNADDPVVVLRNASYRWWVRAFNSDGESTAWTAPEQFFVPTVVVNAPTGAVAGTASPTFSWTGVPEFVRYELWVNNVTTGVSRVVYEPNLTTTTFKPDLPLQNGDFKVWVRGFDAVGNASQWSNPLDFSINATVGNSPQPLNPDGRGAVQDSNVVFEWVPLPNVSQYEILIKELRGSSQPEVLRDFTQGTLDPFTGNLTHPASGTLRAGTYRWWIRGLNADSTPGPWSQPLDFRTVDVESETTIENEVLVASLARNQEWDDSFHSITVHPAAVIVAQVATADPVQADVVGEATATPEFTEAVDTVMQELLLTDLLTDTATEPIQSIAPVTGAQAAKKPTNRTAEQTAPTEESLGQATALGLWLAAISGKGKKGRRRDE